MIDDRIDNQKLRIRRSERPQVSQQFYRVLVRPIVKDSPENEDTRISRKARPRRKEIKT